MALYLDSFNFADWHELMPSNVFHGITTNPLLAKRAGLLYGDIEWHAVIERAAECGAKELHIQVPHTDASVIDFVAARKAEAAHANLTIVIKIPLTDAGILLASNVKALEMPILMTACYHAKQYLIADALKAAFIAPYYGRMDEAGIDAYSHLCQMHDMAKRNPGSCRILVASLRNSEQMMALASAGLDDFTISPALARDLMDEPLTIEAANDFAKAAQGDA